MQDEITRVMEKLNREKEIIRVFDSLVKDIMYAFPQLSELVAERSAITFIQYPQMLVELREIVKEKRGLDENK